MEVTPPRFLIFGYGNPSRGDDALGPACIERLSNWKKRHHPPVDLCLLTDFQLQVEHALDLEDRDLVLFVDASANCPPPYRLRRLQPARDSSYTTHAMSPAAVLQVYTQIRHQPPPPSYVLAIRGERFVLGQGLSPMACHNLDAAMELITRICLTPTTLYPEITQDMGP